MFFAHQRKFFHKKKQSVAVEQSHLFEFQLRERNKKEI